MSLLRYEQRPVSILWLCLPLILLLPASLYLSCTPPGALSYMRRRTFLVRAGTSQGCKPTLTYAASPNHLHAQYSSPYRRLQPRKMEVERGSAVSRARRNPGHPTKQFTPVNTKKSVSVAAVFKQQPRKTKQNDITPHSKSNIPRLMAEDGGAKPMSAKSRSSSRSPQKAGLRVSKNRSDMHPLAVAFRGKVGPATPFDPTANILAEQTPVTTTAATSTSPRR